jgi:acyl-CoA dehydrogenase
MDFAIPAALESYLAELGDFIAAEIKPLEEQDDNIRFFDHRREWARTNFEDQGLPRREWELLLVEAKNRADKAGHWRFSAPKKYGGKDGSNLWMAVIRDRFAAMGLGLHNDLQNEHSIVGNFPFVNMFEHFGTPEQQQEFILGGFAMTHRVAFGLTEPDHGSDATHMETRAVRETRDGVPGWRIDGRKMWITGMHVATHCAAFCRTSGEDGDAKGITCLLVPADNPGMVVDEYMWTFNISRIAGCPKARSSVRSMAGFRSPRASSTRTASARPQARSARRPSVSRNRSNMPASASRSGRNWRATRQSSSPWSSLPPNARCCAR